MGEPLTLDRVLSTNASLIDAGAALHWIVPFQKRPIEKEWSKAPRYTESQWRSSYRQDANIGIRLGEPSKVGDLYLHLIDLDIRKESVAEEARAALLSIWPEAFSFPSVISGSGGPSRHIYFFTSIPLTKKKLAKSSNSEMVWDDRLERPVQKWDWEIDVMGTGSQAALPPSIHPDTRLHYCWERPLDLDMPFLAEVSAQQIENWGVRPVNQVDEDDDDLEGIIGRMPLDLDDAEVDRILASLPNDGAGAHYDDYIEVGMALHHQYQGSEVGFQKWHEWSKQAEKYQPDHARYRWDRSFNEGSKHPVRMATLMQKANTNRLKDELDFETDDAFDAKSTALTIVPSYDLSDLLGGDEPAPKPTLEIKLDQPPENWQSLFHRNEEGELKSTLPNVRIIVDYDARTFGVPAFNEFTSEIVFRHTPKKVRHKQKNRAKEVLNLEGALWAVDDAVNGRLWQDSHDTSLRSIIEAPTTQGGYGIKISDRDLRGAVDIVAQKNCFHPSRETLLGVTWDGIPRMDSLFVDYLGSPDTPYHRNTARLMMLGAVARVFEPGHKFDFVPILEGAQGKGKSTFIKTLAFGWYNELTGDVGDTKMMVENMQGSWIMELGELSAMSKADVNDLKAFVSRQTDKVRLAYAKRAAEFPRQCIFIGSTNDSEYLRDTTGGRRWWPIQCLVEGMIDNKRLAREIGLIWAEAVAVYQGMRNGNRAGELPLYIADLEAAEEAAEMQESRRMETSEEVLAGSLLAWLDTPIGVEFDDLDVDAPKIYRQETCIAQIWEEMMGREGPVSHMESMKIGKAMQLVGWNRSRGLINTATINKKYGKCRVYSRD